MNGDQMLFAYGAANLAAGFSGSLVTGNSPTPVRAFIPDAEAIVDVDTTGTEVFRKVLALMSEHKVTFALSRANKPFIDLLANYHLLDKIAENQIYPTNRHAVEALRDGPASGEPSQ